MLTIATATVETRSIAHSLTLSVRYALTNDGAVYVQYGKKTVYVGDGNKPVGKQLAAAFDAIDEYETALHRRGVAVVGDARKAYTDACEYVLAAAILICGTDAKARQTWLSERPAWATVGNGQALDCSSITSLI